MYWGSVKFFKHIIFGLLLLIFLSLFFMIFHVVMAAAFKSQEKAYLSPSIENEYLSSLPPPQKTGRDRPKAAPAAMTLSSLSGGKAEEAPQPPKNPSAAPDLSYRQQYPDLYSQKPGETVINKNTVYLTFDDGPSPMTPQILKILKENNIKATFFVIGKTDEASKKLMRQITEEGHAIGIHSYTHNYKEIYRSIPAYLEDFDRIYNLIDEATGVKPNIFRFPGGSINSYNKGVYKEIIKETNRRGFTYYDWNVSAADTASDATAKSIYNNIITHVSHNSASIVLLHDSKEKRQTVDALDMIIKDLKKRGFTFDSITNKIKPIVF